MATDSKTECVICGFEIGTDENGWDVRHNAEPFSKGRCCLLCNNEFVIPLRLKAVGYSEEQIKSMNIEDIV